ncbi:putative pentatricopeptide repeat-containing protein At5g40405 [Rutidosis leptorrhynchoides]|uniref:putative pentatricopeptide repeat-containing protein At5g40405 n=1 Tax=Rutidosis leptorrhynchoides TaxID=125765 RepID=UPI003A99D0FD
MPILPQSPAKAIKQKIISLIHNSNQLNDILQIHAFLIKASLQSNNFIITKLLCKLSLKSSANLRYARNVFDEMPSPDTFLYNTIIRAYLNSQNHVECLSLFLRLRRQDHLFVDSFSLSLVVQACGRSGFVKCGQTVHTQILKLGFDSDLFVQTGLIEMYVKFGWVGFAKKVFGGMKDQDLVSFNVLLAEYVRIGEMGLARQLFDKMSQRDLVSWNTMIHGYASLGHVGTFASARSDTCGDKDLVSSSSMVACYSKSSMSHEALKLFNEMQLAKLLPDKITVVSVLSACGDLGALGMVNTIHKYINRNRIEIDIKLGTSLVDTYAKCGDIDNSSKVFSSMKTRDVFTWSAMIMGLANHGYGDVAIDHFNKMISEGIKPNGITLIGVLTACSHIGLVNNGWKYFNAMSDEYGLTPEIEHYGCMVDMLSRAGHIDAARSLINDMPFEPDAIIWRTLLGACKIYKNVEMAEEATSKILSLEGYKDGNYVLLSNVYSEAKKWDKVLNVRNKMKEIRIQKVPGSSSTEVSD